MEEARTRFIEVTQFKHNEHDLRQTHTIAADHTAYGQILWGIGKCGCHFFVIKLTGTADPGRLRNTIPWEHHCEGVIDFCVVHRVY